METKEHWFITVPEENPWKPVVRNHYIVLWVKARAMLIDAGRYDDVAELERLYQELLGDAS